MMNGLIRISRTVDGKVHSILLHVIEDEGNQRTRRIHLAKGISPSGEIDYLIPAAGYVPTQLGGLCSQARPPRKETKTPDGRYARTFFVVRDAEGRVLRDGKNRPSHAAGHWTAFRDHLGLDNACCGDLAVNKKLSTLLSGWSWEGWVSDIEDLVNLLRHATNWSMEITRIK